MACKISFKDLSKVPVTDVKIRSTELLSNLASKIFKSWTNLVKLSHLMIGKLESEDLMMKIC